MPLPHFYEPGGCIWIIMKENKEWMRNAELQNP